MPQIFNCSCPVQVTESFGCTSTFRREACDTRTAVFVSQHDVQNVQRAESGSARLLAQEQRKFKASHVKWEAFPFSLAIDKNRGRRSLG